MKYAPLPFPSALFLTAFPPRWACFISRPNSSWLGMELIHHRPLTAHAHATCQLLLLPMDHAHEFCIVPSGSSTR